jgi:hypothetical protein
MILAGPTHSRPSAAALKNAGLIENHWQHLRLAEVPKQMVGPFHIIGNILSRHIWAHSIPSATCFRQHFSNIELLVIPPPLESRGPSIYKINCCLYCKRRLGCAASLLASSPPGPPVALSQSHHSYITNGPHRQQTLRRNRRKKDGYI